MESDPSVEEWGPSVESESGVASESDRLEDEEDDEDEDDGV